tara:strand:- start:97 stop:561 length:465 start_codon:yes stop_codon:yes gene_type:complete
MDSQDRKLKRLDTMESMEAERMGVTVTDSQEYIRVRLDTLESMKAERKELSEKIDKMTVQIQRQLEADDAVLFEDDAWVAEIKAATVWNEEALIPLLEHYDAEEIKSLQNKVAIPKFNKTKLTKEAKKGGEVKRIIDFAKQEGLPELTIRQKGK